MGQHSAINDDIARSKRRVFIPLSVGIAVAFVTLALLPGASTTTTKLADPAPGAVSAECQAALGYPQRSQQDLDFLNTCVHALEFRADPTPTDTPTPSPTVTVTPTVTATPTIVPTTTPPTIPPTTVPPTTVPATTTPPVTTSSPSGPPTQDQIKASAGVPAGTFLMPFTGTISSGHTYTAVKFTAAQIPGNISASNITFKNCTFATGTIFSGNNITIDHCAITGSGSGISFSGSDNVIFTNNTLTGWDDGLHITADSGPTNNYTITGNWIHAPSPVCGDHSDGVQILGTNGAVFRSNIIDLGPWISCGSGAGNGPLNGAFQIEITQGPVNNVVIDWNYLNGGGYVLRVYQGCTMIHITNNHFGPNAQFGPFDTLKAGSGVVEFSGNVDVNGRALARA